VHRSRLVMLLVIPAFAACSTQKAAEPSTALSQDSALVTRVGEYQHADKQTEKQPFPDACGTFTIPTAAPADTLEARELAQRGYNAELLGNVREASALLRRSSELDAADKSAAYHLGRISEVLGERRPAIQAYCRYLALSPTATEQAEVRRRVESLAQAQAPISARVAVATSGVTHKATHLEQPRVVAKSSVHARTPMTQPKRETHSTTTVASGAVDLPARAAPGTTSPIAPRRADSVVVESDDVEVELPAVERPRADQRGPNRAQSAGIGAVAGAIIGGVAGRSGKSAAIGAVAGGILGAVVVRGNRMN